MQRVVSGREMAEVDRRTIEDLGLPGLLLMENAGRAVTAEFRRRWPQARTVAILCGPGNNGGDGFVVARTLLAHGLTPRLYLVGEPERLKGDALAHYQVLSKLGCPALPFEDGLEGEVVVDALFGTGLGRPLQGDYARAVEATRGRAVLAVDIPSGINSETGQVMGEAVRAEVTVTMGLPKRGLLLEPGASHTGELVVAEIGFPPELLRSAGNGALLDEAQIRDWLPVRTATSHKGSCGHALVLAGSERYPGAAFLATEGALRVGSGLVTLATAPAVRAMLHQRLAVPLSIPLRGSHLRAADRDDLQALAPRMQSFLIGCGLDPDEEEAQILRQLASEWAPLVVDASALRVVAGQNPLGKGRILTPHPGEMSALLGRPVAALEADRIEAALECARRYDCCVVFKGAPTIISDGRSFWVNPTGTSVLSQGGTGDVLAGMIAGLLAQGLDCPRAACCGAYLHGLAGQLAGEQRGPRGIFADEIAGFVPAALARILGSG